MAPIASMTSKMTSKRKTRYTQQGTQLFFAYTTAERASEQIVNYHTAKIANSARRPTDRSSVHITDCREEQAQPAKDGNTTPSARRPVSYVVADHLATWGREYYTRLAPRMLWLVLIPCQRKRVGGDRSSTPTARLHTQLLFRVVRVVSWSRHTFMNSSAGRYDAGIDSRTTMKMPGRPGSLEFLTAAASHQICSGSSLTLRKEPPSTADFAPFDPADELRNIGHSQQQCDSVPARHMGLDLQYLFPRQHCQDERCRTAAPLRD
ncbi:hypothetical protein BU23DRAFT_565516 [Bimuria novae-zelandiae CBS 107.79]|uniref:Uncharacterized protein n=1 Tax=Bimuria novae-zelandiae CBS 107.79 TaxID=1447943 RepID=A0A6A5VJJ1_9PLEO|nr:hypothetical protein BU23DRAFT_565516 [Bimuria novae-zelandiae CBS 107.79]